MVTGPIFRVELVTAARRGRYFAMRVLYAAIILFVLWATYESMGSYRRFSSGDARVSISQMAQTAAGFFVSFSWVQLLGILAVAPAMAVGAIATERERRTIEYLFATDLSNLEIVLGKTLARLLLVGKFVLVSLPILFLFRLLGGIPANLLASSALIAGSTALVVTALSVCVSVWSPRSRDATTRVYRIMFALLILPPILTGFLGVGAVRGGNWQSYVQPVLSFLNGLNPMLVLGSSMSGVFAMGAGFDFAPVLTMAAWHTAISVALIALATTAVRRVHLRETGGPASRAVSAPAPRRRWLPQWRPALGDNAMLWKEAFAPTSRTRLGWVAGAANVLVVVAALGGILYSFACAMLEIDYWNRESYLWFVGMFTGLVGVGLLLLLAARASGLVTIEKERDCWISLISTPLTGGEIMRGKLLGNLYSMRWGMLMLLIAWLLAAFIDARYIYVAALMGFVFLLCAWFVTSVGLLYSLRSNTSLRAMGFTLATTLFVGGGYMMCCCPIVAVGGGGDDDIMVLGMSPCIPFLLTAPAFMFAEDDLNGPGEVMVAYVLGVVGYATACIVLLTYSSRGFDAMAGRTVDIAERHNLPRD